MDTVALRYAEALFALAKEENAIKQYQKDMEAAEAVFHDKSILQFFSHVAIQDEDKYQVLKQSFHGKIQTYVYQFLLLLIKKRRIQCVLLICQQFQQLCYDALGIQVGKVWSAYELTEDQIKKIQDALSTQLNKQVLLKQQVDTQLIGGIKVEIDNHVYDNSLSYKMGLLKQELLRK